MKTIKTRMIEAFMAYLGDRSKRMFIVINWQLLDQLGGVVDMQRSGDTETLNISPHSVGLFEVSDNMLVFNCRFSGRETTCYVPTACIHMIIDPDSQGKSGMQFDPSTDYHVEITERDEASAHNTKSKPAIQPSVAVTGRGASNVSHLKLVKKTTH